MYDYYDNELKIGDFVKTKGRQFNGTEKDKLAIVGEIGKESVVILFENKKLPLAVMSRPAVLRKQDKESIPKSKQKSLQHIVDVFYEIKRNVRSV